MTYDWGTVPKGTVLKIRGERGTFTFRKVDQNGDIEVFGGANGKEMIRTFTADRITIKGKRRKAQQ